MSSMSLPCLDDGVFNGGDGGAAAIPVATADPAAATGVQLHAAAPDVSAVLRVAVAGVNQDAVPMPALEKQTRFCETVYY